jgi:hypothetical protein
VQVVIFPEQVKLQLCCVMVFGWHVCVWRIVVMYRNVVVGPCSAYHVHSTAWAALMGFMLAGRCFSLLPSPSRQVRLCRCTVGGVKMC